MHNPLLDFSGLPRFPEIRPEHVAPAIEPLLAEARTAVAAAERAAPDWDSRSARGLSVPMAAGSGSSSASRVPALYLPSRQKDFQTTWNHPKRVMAYEHQCPGRG